MRLSQMFPKEWLDGEDLNALHHGVTVVTIEAIDYRTKPARKVGQAEVDYYLVVKEFRKPIRLGAYDARVVATVLGSDETDDWIGKTIGIYGAQVQSNAFGQRKLIWVVNVADRLPTTAPTLPAKSDITGLAGSRQGTGGILPRPTAPASPSAAAIAGATPDAAATLGVATAATVLSSLRERGRTLQDLVAHLRDNVGAGDLIGDRELQHWPVAVIPMVRKFVAGFPRSAAPMTAEELERTKASMSAAPAREVVDRSTGEVITPAAGKTHEAGPHAPIPPEDDIPF